MEGKSVRKRVGKKVTAFVLMTTLALQGMGQYAVVNWGQNRAVVYADDNAEENNNTANNGNDSGKLLNGSFEKGQTWTESYKQPNQDDVPAWNTTATDKKIELFKKNTNVYIKNNVTLKPTDGIIAAELNAEEESTLYQNVTTKPSSIYQWGLDHGARNGTDTMALVNWTGSVCQSVKTF